MKKKRLFFAAFLSLVFGLVCLSSCNQSTVLSSTFFAFDTMISIKLYEGESSDLTSLESLLKKIGKLSDPYTDSEEKNVYYLNKYRKVTDLDPLLEEMLEGALLFSRETNGAFSPLLGDLTSLYKEQLAKGNVPSNEEIQLRLQEAKESSYVVSNGTFTLTGKGDLDLGAVAKGFALKKAKEYLVSKNITKYLIDGGGSSILLGEKPSGDNTFSVSFADISGAYIKKKNVCVSTSSISEQSYEIGGVTYSHIINPFNGSALPIRTMVSYLCEDPFKGDAYVTAMFTQEDQQVPSLLSKGEEVVLFDGKKITYQSDSLEIFHQ